MKKDDDCSYELARRARLQRFTTVVLRFYGALVNASGKHKKQRMLYGSCTLDLVNRGRIEKTVEPCKEIPHSVRSSALIHRAFVKAC